MTKITLFIKNSHYCGYEFLGHADFQEGNDIVCAAISILSQTCTNTLSSILKIDLKLREDSIKGYLKVDLPDLDSEVLEKSDLVITQMKVGLDGIMDLYPKHVKVRTKEVLK